MTVTKRGLLKVIILLTIIDIIAGIWYMTLRIENSGESHDLFETTDTVTEEADTIPSELIPDSFFVAENHGYFIAQLPNVKGGNTTLACKKLVHVKMPVTVNGMDSLNMLNEAIIEKAFALHHHDINAAMAAFTSTPKFTVDGANASFTRVDSLHNVGAGNLSIHSIYIYPTLSSQRLLVMRIDYGQKNGNNAATTTGYVNFDRQTMHVYTQRDIFKADIDNELIGILNEKIATLNSKNPELKLRNAAKIPGELYVRRKGISFFYAPGEIASIGEGEIELFIPHSVLEKLYTSPFLSMLNANSGWFNYGKP